MQIRIESSQKKKLIEETSNFREMEMRFLDPESSRQYSQVMEQIMKTNLRKQSVRTLQRKRSSVKSFQKDYDSASKEKTINITNSHVKEDKVQIKSEEKEIQDIIRKIPYKFSFKSYFIQLFVAYCVTFSILYLIQLANFPYYQIILTIAFMMSIDPWKSSNVILLLAIPIIIANYVLNLSFFTYPCIVICYYSVMSFNEKHKSKQVFILVLVFIIIYGLIILPAIYKSLEIKIAFFYMFPLLMFFIRLILNYSYWMISHSAAIFLQLPLFITGLEYGVILTRDISSIEFWYLLVMFSLQIINDRTQFTLRLLVNISEYCSKANRKQKEEKQAEKIHPILPAHANGYSSINSFHLFLLVYIYSGLSLYTAPYDSSSPLKTYTYPSYKPTIVWLLSSIYEVMSLVLQKNAKHKLLLGFTSNKWWRSVLRGFILSLGMWLFYIGLGVGVLLSPQI